MRPKKSLVQHAGGEKRRSLDEQESKAPGSPRPRGQRGDFSQFLGKGKGRKREGEGQGKGRTQTGGSSEPTALHVNKQRKRFLQRASRWPGGKQPHAKTKQKAPQQPGSRGAFSSNAARAPGRRAGSSAPGPFLCSRSRDSSWLHPPPPQRLPLNYFSEPPGD